MSLDPSFAPNETAELIFDEVAIFVGSSILSSFSLGLQVALYILCLSTLIPQLKGGNTIPKKKVTYFYLFYTTCMTALSTIQTAANGRVVQVSWINNRNYPGGPLYFLGTHPGLACYVVQWIATVISGWFQDAYALYRLWVFWDNIWICAFPALIFLGVVASSLALLAQISTPIFGITSPLGHKLTVSWYTLSVSLNVIATLAIVARLLWKRRSINAVLGKEHSRVYTGLVAMLIESAALYAIFGIAFIGAYFRGDSGAGFILPLLANIQGIAPLLIIYRVSSGRGWTRDTMQRVSQTHFKPVVVSRSTVSDGTNWGGITALGMNKSGENVTRDSESEHHFRGIEKAGP